MKKKLFCLTFIFLILTFLFLNTEFFAGDNNKKSQQKEILNPTISDLSTPEKTIKLFFKAFRTGDNRLLDKVLAPYALISEFNPLQRIESPASYIKEPQIIWTKVLNERRKYSDPDFYTEPTDVEIYLSIESDPSQLKNKFLPKHYRTYILRKFGEKWKIIYEYTPWSLYELID